MDVIRQLNNFIIDMFFYLNRNNFYIYLIIHFFLFACANKIKVNNTVQNIDKNVIRSKNNENDIDSYNLLNKLDTVKVIKYLNLSRLELTTFPNLSKYKILNLNISHNKLDTIPLDYLPITLLKLSCSHNNIKSFRLLNDVTYKNRNNNSKLNIEEIDFSYNKLISFSYTVTSLKDKSFCKLKKLNLSNNNLNYLSVNCSNLKWLNISNNYNLSNEVNFHVKHIDTIIHYNIKNNNPLFLRKIPLPIINL
jgi:hypothetical protein